MLRSEKCCAIMKCKIVLVSVLLQVSFSFDLSDDDNHQGLVQLARIERPGYWTVVEDKSQSNSALPYSRLGSKIFKLPQTLIPYPRAGRMLLDPDIFEYEESLLPDFSFHNIADGSLANIIFAGKSLSPKRASIAFPPRIGRKKRSISSEEDQLEDNDHDNVEEVKKSLSRSPSQAWSDEFEPDFYFRPDRRSNSRSRNSFVPRVGKKRSSPEHGMAEEMVENKRALAFQPRVGRDSLISRLERNDPRGIFQVESRGAFIPRIGRRAAFIPRVGRDVSHSSAHDKE